MAGNELFGVDIAGILRDATRGELLDATLHVVAAGTRTPGALTAGTNPTETDKTAEGFVDETARRQVGGTVVTADMTVVVLIGDSIEDDAVPKVGDKVTIESVKYNIRGLDRDPAKATYTLACTSE